MVLRRHKKALQAVFGVIIIIVAVRYCYKYYKDTSMELKAANIRHHELLEDRNRFSREVEVLTQSKTDLEYAVNLKSVEFRKYRNECQTSKNKFENQINRDKSESLARFNALDSEYRMLKANKDDLETEHKHLKKNFERLKTDHGKIDSAYKRNIQDLKEKNEKVITSLQSQVEYHQKQEDYLSIQVKDLKATVLQYQTTLNDLMSKLTKEKASQTIEHESKNAEQSQSKRITRNTGRFSKESKQTGEKMNTIEDDILVKDNSLKSPKLHHNIKRGYNKPNVEQKTADLNNKTSVFIEPVVIKDMKRTRRAENNGRQREDVEELYKRQEKWKDVNVDDTNFNGVHVQQNERNKGVLLDDDFNHGNDAFNHGNDAFNHGNDQLNNDQKFDDHDVALQEGDVKEDNTAGGDGNEMLENEKLLEQLL